MDVSMAEKIGGVEETIGGTEIRYTRKEDF